MTVLIANYCHCLRDDFNRKSKTRLTWGEGGREGLRFNPISYSGVGEGGFDRFS